MVAAFAPWHEFHDLAMAAMRDEPRLPAHCGIEAYATLTRLPEPYRAPGPVVSEYLRLRFPGGWLFPSEEDVWMLPQLVANRGIIGGASYDALVAITGRAHDAHLRTFDRRAIGTYQSIGVDFELLG